jgi:hypothetical protein
MAGQSTHEQCHTRSATDARQVTRENAAEFTHTVGAFANPSFRLAITTNWRNSWKNPLKPSENVAM